MGIPHTHNTIHNTPLRHHITQYHNITHQTIITNSVTQNCRMEKAFLIDVVSKISVAADSTPDIQTYELCSDMIDVVIDVSCIYGCVFHQIIYHTITAPP